MQFSCIEIECPDDDSFETGCLLQHELGTCCTIEKICGTFANKVCSILF